MLHYLRQGNRLLPFRGKLLWDQLSYQQKPGFPPWKTGVVRFGAVRFTAESRYCSHQKRDSCGAFGYHLSLNEEFWQVHDFSYGKQQMNYMGHSLWERKICVWLYYLLVLWFYMLPNIPEFYFLYKMEENILTWIAEIVKLCMQRSGPYISGVSRQPIAVRITVSIANLAQEIWKCFNVFSFCNLWSLYIKPLFTQISCDRCLSHF